MASSRGLWFAIAGSVVWLPVMIILLHFLGANLWIDSPTTLLWLVLSALVCLALNLGPDATWRGPRGNVALPCGAVSWVAPSIAPRRPCDEIARFEQE